MKKFFKPSVCISIFMCALIIGVSTLSVFLAQQKINTKGEVTQNSKSFGKYFKARSVDQAISTRFNLNFDAYKDKILWNFTNWNSATATMLYFEKEKIASNILLFMSAVLKDYSQFSNVNSLYINVKYELINTNSLIIDIRWANIKELQKQQSADLFWEMQKINLS